MLSAACPGCGGEITFRSKTSVLCVCRFCRSNIVRHDIDLEVIGKQAELMEDMSPLQIGVNGKYRNKSFQILGRQILSWSDGLWNEWYIAFSDGTDGWLAEAQGEFSILLAPETRVKLPLPHEIDQLSSFPYKSSKFEIVDRKKIKCLGSEGELPFKTVEGSQSTVYDYSDNKNGFASIEVDATSEVHIYIGEFTSLGSLRVSGIRYFSGWGKP